MTKQEQFRALRYESVGEGVQLIHFSGSGWFWRCTNCGSFGYISRSKLSARLRGEAHPARCVSGQAQP